MYEPVTVAGLFYDSSGSGIHIRTVSPVMNGVYSGLLRLLHYLIYLFMLFIGFSQHECSRCIRIVPLIASSVIKERIIASSQLPIPCRVMRLRTVLPERGYGLECRASGSPLHHLIYEQSSGLVFYCAFPKLLYRIPEGIGGYVRCFFYSFYFSAVLYHSALLKDFRDISEHFSLRSKLHGPVCGMLDIRKVYPDIPVHIEKPLYRAFEVIFR